MPAPCGRFRQPLTAAQIAGWRERHQLKVIICATNMNAHHGIEFRIAHNISRDIKTGVGCDPYLLQTPRSQEMIMASPRKWRWRPLYAAALASAAALLSTAALASQGPGGGPGTASPLMQLVMAIIVYGTSALVVGAGLIGAARRR
jgi:hypothetical protein